MKHVIFACVHSAGRSQMAAAWFNALVHPAKARAIAAGTQPAAHVHPIVIEAMHEVGIDLRPPRATPTLLTGHLIDEASMLVTMGCGEQCPVTPAHIQRCDWAFDDPKGKPLHEVRIIRDRIRDHVEHLVTTHGWLSS